MHLDMRSSPTLFLDNGAMAQEFAWINPEIIFSLFAHQPFSLWLDSADKTHPASRYSYIVANPYRQLVAHTIDEACEYLAIIKEQLQLGKNLWGDLPAMWRNQLPPFKGGMAGVFSYDLGRAFETLPDSKTPFAVDDQHLPIINIGCYESVLAFDHHTQCAYIIASGRPEETIEERQKTAQQQIEEWSTYLSQCPPTLPPPKNTKASFVDVNFSRQQYCDRVEKIIQHILDGDIFQANLSQRFCFLLNEDDDNFNFYRRLRRCNAAPYSAFGQYGEWSIASASPERFLHLDNKNVHTKPIKGTAPRSSISDVDAQLAAGLLLSEKDRAENIMIVDLLRNDLARVCEDDSINVSTLCTLESFSKVHHLVSNVNGQLRSSVDAIDLLHACFPGGSITGAPKIRAMEIIAEYEPTLRGFYCGSIGYIGFDGVMDINIAIRTAICQNNIKFQVGGGITAISEPDKEYRETLDKALGILLALGWKVEDLENEISQ